MTFDHQLDPANIGWRTAYAETRIDAPPETVWAVLIDFAAYDAWNPFTYDVDMPRFAVGEMFTFTVRMSENNHRRQRETITHIEAPYVLGWRFPNPTPLLNPVRYQVLTPTDDGGTRYQTWETFTGLLGPIVVMTLLAAINRGFADVATALKATAEGKSLHEDGPI